MELDIVALIKQNPQLLVFVLLALAYFVGRIKIGKFQLGSAAGILIVSIVFGHFGFQLFPGIGSVGFIFFLYAVAFQAGPGFFSVALADGAKYIGLAAVVAAVAAAVTSAFSLIFHFDPGTTVGLFSGALTASAGLAAGMDAVQSGAVKLPSGFSAANAIHSMNVSYAISYLFGLIGVVVFIRSMPNWLGFDLRAEAVRAAFEKHVVDGDGGGKNRLWALTLRAYQVKNPDMVGRTVAELQHLTQCSVQMFKRDGLLIDFQPETRLELDDCLSIGGMLDHQEQLHALLGPEIVDQDLLAFKITSYDAIATKPEVIGKTIKEMGITENYGCYLTSVTRSGIDLTSNSNLIIEKGDVLALAGMQSRLDKLVDKIGYVERNVNQTDLVTFAAGAATGFLIGQIKILLGGIPIGLGTAGGLLLVGIFLGHLRSIHPTFGRVPPATLWIFKELGLLMFLAETGIKAGQGIEKAMLSLGPLIFLCGVVVSTLPIFAGYFYGTLVLKMNRALLLGAIAGAMANTPGMAAISEDSRSSIPAIGYAGTYVFANIFFTIVGSILVRL